MNTKIGIYIDSNGQVQEVFENSPNTNLIKHSTYTEVEVLMAPDENNEIQVQDSYVFYYTH